MLRHHVFLVPLQLVGKLEFDADKIRTSQDGTMDPAQWSGVSLGFFSSDSDAGGGSCS